MSIYRPNVQTQQAIRRQKTALTARLRENMRLKIVSLIAAVCLYVFVQAEHNPTITREFTADIIYNQVPAGAVVDTTQRAVTFSVSGPRPLMETLKDGDIHACANFQNKPLSPVKNQSLVQLAPSIPKLTPEQFAQLSIDQTNNAFKFRLIASVARTKAVSITLKPSPAGYRYGKPTFDPPEVTLNGREDQVDMVERVTALYTISEDGKIKGSFPVFPRDHDGNILESVKVLPTFVHVSVPLVADAPARIVTVSANITDYPQPPWAFLTCDVEPRQVKISGNTEAVNRIFTLATRRISLRNETESREITTDLIVPDGIKVQDTKGNPVDSVKVHITIHKTATVAPKDPSTPPDLPPVDPNG